MPDPTELEEPNSETAQTGPVDDIGGGLDEEGRFQSDFGSVIDKISQGVKQKDGSTLVPAEDLIGDGASGPTGAATGPTGAAEAATGPTGAATGPTGAATGSTGAASGPTGAATGPTGADDRDKDLHDLQSQLGDLEKRPKTKQIIEGYKGKVTQERNLRAAIEKERDDLKKQLEEAAKRPVPKEIDEELQALRDTVRDIDAARDPSIQAKYDKRMTANEDKIVGLLKLNGYGMDKDGKEIPGAIDTLKKGGLTRRALQDTISKLEKSGDGAAVEAAEEIKELLRENGRLAGDKTKEIEAFKAGAEDRKKAADAEIQKQVEAANKRVTEQIAEHVGKWDFLKEPPQAKPEDPPAVRAEKEKARVAHNEAVTKWNDAIRKETETPMDAQVAARVGLLYRDLIAPRLQSQLDAARKEADTLREQVKAMKGAGDLSKKGGSVVKHTPPKDDSGEAGNYEDAVDAAAKKLGLI